LRSVLAGQDSHEISMSASHSDFPRLVRQVSLVEENSLYFVDYNV